jgi:uncharacterized repeat protein (TIGR03837 family)
MDRQSVDIFCTVIDNFGDIGVCWRLAKQLQQEYQLTVRLWVDDLVSFSKLEPTLALHLSSQYCQKIEICYWPKDNFPTSIQPYDVVIEGFACRLPESFIQAMATQPIKPIWLNLEYLSAESWTLGCHGLSSPHPKLPLKQTFFFPSFDERGGGLLRESDLLMARDTFQQDKIAQTNFWQSLGYSQAMTADYRLSLFAYENNAVPALLEALSLQSTHSFLAVPEGRVLANVSAWSKQNLSSGDCITIGSLTIAVLPFLSPTEYDQLLWACDVNMVRGEDSFIRGHWAARPLLWHIYPQEENAHWPKLEAWLDVIKNVSPNDAESYLAAQRGWNRGDESVTFWRTHWPFILSAQPIMQLLSEKLSQQSHLAVRLIEFCRKQ